MKNEGWAFVLLAALAAVMTVNIVLGAKRTQDVDDRTKFLCAEYAARNHIGEFTPERYAANKDLIDNYDWYTSCINHVKYPVAGGRP